MITNSNEFEWVQKYRPSKVEDIILPAEIKDTFLKFAEKGDFQNMLLAGPRGMGKTTAALALVAAVGGDFLKINASLERNIDTLRDKVLQFVTTVSFTGGRKYVILDEADGLSPLTQQALKGFIEEFSHNACFILTANHIGKIIPEISQSRMTVIEYKIPSAERPVLAMAFMKRLCEILDAENVTYEKKALSALIMRHFPDWRRVLNEVQRYASKGPINTGILANMSNESIDQLIGFLKKKDFTAVRKWVTEEAGESSAQAVFRTIYDRAPFTPATLAEVVLIFAKYGFQSAFAVDQEINTAAALVEVMMVAAWKE
jgi:DNA polymerase III delta prime subunit